MKKIIYIFTAVIALTLVGCYGDDVSVELQEAANGEANAETLTAAKLKDLSSNAFEIKRTTDSEQGNEGESATTISWDAATTSTSESISYMLQLDATNNKFETAVTIPLGSGKTSELSQALTYGQLNDAVNKIAMNLKSVASALGVTFGEANDFDLRLVSILGANIAMKYSETTKISITPYFTGLVDELVFSGEALSGVDTSAKNADGKFEARLKLTTDKMFKIYASPKEDAISYNYAYFTDKGYTIDSNLSDDNGGFKFTGETGTWDIVVNSNDKTISLSEVIIPDNLYMVGSHNDWNNGDATQEFTNNGSGIFTKVQAFDAGAQFKLLPTSGSWDGDWGESKTTPGTIIQDDEDNIKVENAGTYLVRIDFNTLTYKLYNISSLFMVGSYNDWNNADATQEFYTSGNGIFTKVQTFDAGAQFKLLPTSGSWDGDWGESKTTPGTIVQDGEDNIKVENAGTYMVTINFNNFTYNLTEIPDALYLVGSPNSWDNNTAPAFTKVAEGVFEISQALTASDEFKFLPQQGSWDNDWGGSKVYEGMLERNDEKNVKSSGDGTYTITVDFNKGMYIVEKQ